MSKILTIKLTGFKELEQKLRAMGPAIVKNGLRASNFAGASVIKEAMIGAAPVKTGLMKQSIAMFRRPSTETKVTHAIGFRRLVRAYPNTPNNRRKRRVGKKHKVDGPAYYARFVEFGTSKWPSGNPFMRRTLSAFAPKAIDAVRDALAVAVERAKG